MNKGKYEEKDGEDNRMYSKTAGMDDGNVCGKIRLNLFISRMGICSRREADRLIEAGRVTVDECPGQAGMKVSPGQIVCLDGKRLDTAREHRRLIYAVNKPVGVVCTSDRRWGDPLLEDLVKSPERVFYLGRLDKASEGLILMSNIGELVNDVMRAGNFHEKEYLVTVDKNIDEIFLEAMRAGVFLPELNVKTRTCEVEKTGKNTFRIILTQGLNRQIRRMCGALGYQVTSLKRVRVMNIRLGDLKPGEYRLLTDAETDELLRGIGKKR